MQLPPPRKIRPSDSGGSIARAGFAFQDHVAAGFCIEMLTREDLKEVWCETYDDIVLVWDKAGEELFEFVQVKAENHDQLWTTALLCQRDKKKDKPDALLALVKDAAQRPDSKREKKFLKVQEIRAFIREQAEPFPGLGPSERLNGKLSIAGLPETERETAQELRRAYLKAARTRSYLETGGTPPFANAVLYQLLRLHALISAKYPNVLEL